MELESESIQELLGFYECKATAGFEQEDVPLFPNYSILTTIIQRAVCDDHLAQDTYAKMDSLDV